MKPIEEFTLAVDTDSYAGNFERELFVFMTGMPYDYDDIHPLALPAFEAGKEALGEDRFEDLLDLRIHDPGDDGICRSHVTLVPSPGPRAYNSIGIFLKRRPTIEELAILKKRAFLFETFPTKHGVGEQPKILGFRLLKTIINATEESL